MVKPVLRLISLLPLINWMGVALVTLYIVHARQDAKVDAILCGHRRKHINYLAIATRWSALVIKVSGRMSSDESKEG